MAVLQQNLIRERKVQEQTDEVPMCGMHAPVPNVSLGRRSPGSQAGVTPAYPLGQ